MYGPSKLPPHRVLAHTLPSVLQLLWLPPNASTYTGPGTWWDLAWRLLTLRPLFGLFARGTFMRAYALIVIPVLGVWAVGIAALLARADLLKPLVKSLPLLSCVALCLVGEPSLVVAWSAVSRGRCAGRDVTRYSVPVAVHGRIWAAQCSAA